MHVCMISGWGGFGGGAENVVHALSTFLTKNGIQVTIFNSGFTDITKVSENCITEEIRPYTLLPARLQFAFYDRYAYSLKVWRRITSSNSFDVIHGHADNCFFPALFRDRTPFVANIHGVKKAGRTRLLGANSQVLKNPRYFPMLWPEEVLAKKSDIVAACSKAEREDLIEFYRIDPAKIKVIYNGVDLAKFKPMNKLVARKILGLPEKRDYAIWVGNNPTLKGLTTAIRAVRNQENLYLLVVGISGNNFDNVLFFGMISDPQKLRALYNAANFLIFPTLYEAFGLVALEAMACGVPIIISKECPVKEIIQDGIEGFVVDQRKPECYTEKIVELLKAYPNTQESNLRCRKLAERYSWENVGREYMKVYSRFGST